MHYGAHVENFVESFTTYEYYDFLAIVAANYRSISNTLRPQHHR